MSKDDPTELKNVLAALEKSEKLRHWHRPPKDFGPDNPEFSEYNRNGLTDPGDISTLSFTEEFAFGESSSDETDENEENEDQEEVDDAPIPDDLFLNISTLPDWMDPSEETYEEDGVSSLQSAGGVHHQNLLLQRMEEMSLDDEYKKICEQNTMKHYKKYAAVLRQIKDEYDEKLEKCYKERDEKLALEEFRLRKQEEEASQTVRDTESEYILYVRQRSFELNKLVEDAERREAEQRNVIQCLINDLHSAKSAYTDKHDHMKQLLKDLNGEQMLEPSVEAQLNDAVNHINGILESASKDVMTQNDLMDAKKLLQSNITKVDGIIQALKIRIEEKIQLESERANQQAKEAAAAKNRAELEDQAAAMAAAAASVKQEEQREPDLTEASTKEHQMAALLTMNRMRYEELKKKMEDSFRAQDAVDNERKKDVGRINVIINQLHGSDQNINREKLQKLLAYLGGRNVNHNNKIYCTNNDPVLTAYVKTRLMSHIIKVGHDTQAKVETSITAYAWLIVSLVSAYPDLWEVFLYHIYTTCPYLVPLYVFREDGQSDEDFEKARGMRQKEKSDSYFSRMGNASLLFGLVLAQMGRRNGMPEQAPIVGWKLLAGLLTLHPTPGVSAIVLKQFLTGMGSELQQTYGKQFAKLMNYAINVYMPLVEETTDAASGSKQTLNQLKLLFDEYRKTYKIKPYEYLDKFR